MFSILGYSENSAVQAEETFFEDVRMDFLFSQKEKYLIKLFFTSDERIIKRRGALFYEIIKNPSLMSFFAELRESIDGMQELCKSANKISPSAEENETLYYSFCEFQFFTEAIELICRKLADSENESLRALYEKAEEVRAQAWYDNAKSYITDMKGKLRGIKSVTIGVNLDAQLVPKEAGIIAVNADACATNSLFDKLFCEKAKDKSLICIAPLGIHEARVEEKALASLKLGLYRAINDIMRASLKKIRKILREEFVRAAEFLFDIADEVKFIDISNKYILSMQAKGVPLCLPTAGETHFAEGFYNPEIVLSNKKCDIVANDIFFDKNGKIFILTGANSGGKSVYLRSVGVAQVIFQLGLPLPAKKAEMTIFESLFSCFRGRIKDKVGGSLENECKMVASICEKVTERSLVLFDEVFSTTSSYDACLIAEKVIEHFARTGCAALYVTHIHELIEYAGCINENPGIKSKIDFLSAGYAGGNRSYKIIREKCNYGSAAMDIFKKYGMEFLI